MKSETDAQGMADHAAWKSMYETKLMIAINLIKEVQKEIKNDLSEKDDEHLQHAHENLGAVCKSLLVAKF